MKRLFLFLLLSIICSINFSQELPEYITNEKIEDIFIPAEYQNPEFEGYLGERIKINMEKRLLGLDLDSILEPFRNRPGKQPWIGEHVGKFLHASSLIYKHFGNEDIKKRMDYAAKELIKTQMPDGYLGTYIKANRWTSWDVWSHKYNMIGLLSYYKVTGYKPALNCCKKMADLICNTFGEDKRDIIKSGTHVGMAPSSILEPMVTLYKYTGKKQYVEFCKYIVNAWEQPHGPQIVSSLLKHGNVYKTANKKAYEMLSCLVGLLELYRVTGEEDFLKACTNAWQDIMINRHYIIGTTSYVEHFRDNHDLIPHGKYGGSTKFIAGGEGCVTVTWEQLTWHLFRLTGEQKYVNELETIIYNALIGAQSPHTGKISYFSPLNGRKRYGEVNHGILPDICCCSSSIPRGIALIPEFLSGTINGDIVLNIYENGKYKIKRNGNTVSINIRTFYPKSGTVDIFIDPEKEEKISVLLNVPQWCDIFNVHVSDDVYNGNPGEYLVIKRKWKKGDVIRISMDMKLKIIPDNDKNSNKVAIMRGPQVLTIDDNILYTQGLPRGWFGNQIYSFKGKHDNKNKIFRMVPYADAGQSMADYCVLLDKIEFIGEQPTKALIKYREQLDEFRNEYGGSSDMPDIKFFLFGMGNRTKYLFKDGKLLSIENGNIIKEWLIKNQTIIPNEYKVIIETFKGEKVTIFENENGVYISSGTNKSVQLEGTNKIIKLPNFIEYKYNEILKVLHHEVLINIIESKPVPNLFVYKKPWRRDAAMMAMCLIATGNIELIKSWILNLDEPYDFNNKRNGIPEQEADNLGQTLYLLSLFADKDHPLVNKILSELSKFDVRDENGNYIKGRTDGREHPNYQTKWLKFGLKSLGLKDNYDIPTINEGYNTLFWWDYKNPGKEYEESRISRFYPYITWAKDHYFGRKKNPISNRDYPLTWEIKASHADYKELRIIDEQYWREKISAPHTWHASEVFLYLLDL